MLVSRARIASILAAAMLVAAGCASPPSSTLPKPSTAPRSTTPPPAPKQTQHSDATVLELAREYLGTPYRYGGSTRKGMDCSGLVLRVFERAGQDLPRTSASQFKVGQRVAASDLMPGDLVFFANGSGRVNHVGIYAGGRRFIHASTGKRVVRYDSLDSNYFRSHYAGARRVSVPAR
jgi:cell wall-associated NlpC family hydrolase